LEKGRRRSGAELVEDEDDEETLQSLVG
jgi:hypothetical protein